jgi:hypothetical protein
MLQQFPQLEKICGISLNIPGLTYFNSENSEVGSRVVEQHFMFLSNNRYEGQIFHRDEDKKSWGMTNHPIKDTNQFDIPHNVVYSYNSNNSSLAIGIDYAACGFLSSNLLTKKLAEFVTKKAMVYAVSKVENSVRNVGKSK